MTGRRGAKLRLLLPLLLCVPSLQGQVRDGDLAGMRARSIGPAGMSGRITAIDAVVSDPDVVYVGAATGGVWKSTNGGQTWRPIFDGQRMLGIGAIAVDQANPDVVWVGTGEGNPGNGAGVGAGVYESVDGGETWALVGLERSERIHTILLHPTNPAIAYVGAMGPAWSDGEDVHAVWIDPGNARHLYAGTDGGLYVSRDGGENWRSVDNLPLGRFYHVSVDMDVPYNVYGGMPGSGSWRGPSDVWAEGGIRNHRWTEVAVGYGFGTLVDPQNPRYGYAMSQAGTLIRFDARTGERKRIRPWAPDSTRLRFNWNAAIAADPYVRGGLYYGSQFVHRSPDGGDTWQIISADLTTNDPAKQRPLESDELTRDVTGAKSHTTITTIAPSALSQDVIWVGTDDGRVQVTTAGGGQWYDRTGGMGGLPDGTWVAHVEASKFRVGGAFAVFDGHRQGDWAPYVYRTDDYGDDWDRIADRDDIDGYVHTLEQDPEAEELLFAGTEFGLYVTLNGGDDWLKWTHGLPPVPVRSLVIHPRDHDLVIGTHGRSVYVLDDIRPLRELSTNPGAADVAVFLFEPPPAYVHATAEAKGPHFVADAMFEGRAREPGALLSYWLGEGEDEPVTIEILDLEDEVVRTLEGRRDPGLNRVVWDLRQDLPEALLAFRPPVAGGAGAAPEALQVLPGIYTVRISRGSAESRRRLEVLPDPRVDVDMTDRIIKYRALEKAQDLDVRLSEALEATRGVREGVERSIESLRTEEAGRETMDDLAAAGRQLLHALDEVADFPSVYQYRSGVSGLSSSYDRPTEGQRIDLIRMDEALDALTERVNEFLLLDVARFRNQVEAAGLDGFPRVELISPFPEADPRTIRLEQR